MRQGSRQCIRPMPAWRCPCDVPLTAIWWFSARPLPAVVLAALLATCLLFPGVAQAQQMGETSPELNSPMPRCGPQTDGDVYCKFGRVYECELVSPNSLERRTGWRWKADILRSCDEPVAAPPPQSLPPGFSYAPQQSDSQNAPNGSSAPGNTMTIRPDNLLRPSYRGYRN